MKSDKDTIFKDFVANEAQRRNISIIAGFDIDQDHGRLVARGPILYANCLLRWPKKPRFTIIDATH